MSFDLNSLDFNNAGSWPLPIKLIAVVLVMVAVGGAGFYLDTKDQIIELEKVQQEEPTLKDEFKKRQQVWANLMLYRAQLEELKLLLKGMLQQLPTSTDMPALLEDITNTGYANGLSFELFRPEAEQPRDFYAAKPISIRARANFHQFGSFISAIAALSRIVTLESATLSNPAVNTQSPGGQANQSVSDIPDEENPQLIINAKLQTYRYLEVDEAETEMLNKPGAPAAPGTAK